MNTLLLLTCLALSSMLENAFAQRDGVNGPLPIPPVNPSPVNPGNTREDQRNTAQENTLKRRTAAIAANARTAASERTASSPAILSSTTSAQAQTLGTPELLIVIGPTTVLIGNQHIPIVGGKITYQLVSYLVCGTAIGQESRFICCQSILFDKTVINEPIQCCGSSFFKSQSEFCCGDLYYPNLLEGNQLSCCNGLPYAPQNERCCQGLTIQNNCAVTCPTGKFCCGILELFPNTAIGCCNDVTFPTATKTCCSGNSVDGLFCPNTCQAATNQFCCGSTAIAQNSGIGCCDGTSFILESQSCCNRQVVNSRTCPVTCQATATEFCCGNEAVSLTAGKGCCNTQTYTLASQSCCNDIVTGSPSCTGTGQFCSVSTATQLCCGNILFPRIPGQSCCGAQLYTLGQQSCCNGIVTNSPSCTGTGQFCSVSTATQLCCGNILFPRIPGQSCCGAQLYTLGQQSCCNGIVTNSPSCTGTGQFCSVSTATQLCCGNILFPRIPGQSCCGAQLYTLGQQSCCNGIVTNSPSCTGAGQFCTVSTGTFLCCGNRLVPNAPGRSCCGGQLFTLGQQSCCNGIVTNSPFCTGTGQFCSFSSATQLCCGNIPFPRVLGQSCCGAQLYTLGQQSCCNGIVTNSPSCTGAGQFCTVSTGNFLCCGNRLVPNAPGRTCCGAQLYTLGQQSCCNGIVTNSPSCTGTGQFCSVSTTTQICCGNIPFPRIPGRSCCGRQLYTLGRQRCCNGIVTNSPSCTGTGQFCSVSTATQICCGNIPFPRIPGRSCCGRQLYTLGQQSCCNGVVTNSPSCTGTGQFCTVSTATQLCCGNIPFPRIVGRSCCGRQLYTLGQQSCCNGVVTNSPSCTGTGQFCTVSTGTFLCCGNRLVPNAPGRSCCGGQIYTLGQQSCCNGIVTNSPSCTGTGQFCSFSTATQLCCGNIPFPRVLGQNCCGAQLYTLGQQSCCNGIVTNSPSCTVTGQFCSVSTTTQLCCGNIPFPRVLGQNCCGAQLYTLGQQSCCNGIVTNSPSCTVTGQFCSVSTATQLCCGNILFPRIPGQSCCGAQLYTLGQQSCCNGIVTNSPSCTGTGQFCTVSTATQLCCGNIPFPRIPGQSCCGVQVYTLGQQSCCNGNVIQAATCPVVSTCQPTTTQSCCGATLISTASQSCCNGQVISLSGQGCCGSEVFDKATQNCCGSARFTTSLEVCCGGNIYSSAAFCCVGNRPKLRLRAGSCP